MINPNNFLFRNHLCKLSTELLRISTHHSSVQINKPVQNQIGRHSTKFRDCNDISVNFAFGINTVQPTIDLMNFEMSECFPRNY